ncbi:MAG: hypothetical protein GXO37_05325, partial [Chloroflexi bacterium]|nr:hypothetical protein [Chloroflexota bacterium]
RPPSPTATARATATATASPTPEPSPSATPKPLETLVQGAQVTPFTVPWPTATATPEAVPTLDVPIYAPVHIYTPGPGSKVTSPIYLHFQVQMEGVRVMHIELRGEDGRLLFRQVERFRPGTKGWRGYQMEIPFEIRAESEWGRLQIYLRDERDRPLFQQAVPLVLLRQGREDIIPQETWAAGIIIREPWPGARVRDGELRVSGFAIPTTGLVEVLVYGDDGRIWFRRTASVSEPNAQGYGTFEVTIPYEVQRTRAVYIVVQSYGDEVPGVMYLNHTWAYLAP